MSDRTTITFEDRDGTTGEALYAAILQRIDKNAERVERLAEILDDADDRLCTDPDCEESSCAQETFNVEEAEHDIVGYVLDSFRLARVVYALT